MKEKENNYTFYDATQTTPKLMVTMTRRQSK